MLSYDEERIICEGQGLILKQFGRESFKNFIFSFFDNLSLYQNKYDKSSNLINLNFELEENIKLQPSSICLSIVKENKIAMTLMLSKRINQKTFTEEYFGLDLGSMLKNNDLQNISLYQISKLSIRGESFTGKETELKYELLKLLCYFIFQKMLNENVSLAFANIHSGSAIALNKIKLNYEVVTQPKIYRGFNTFGIVVQKESLVTFLNSWDFEIIMNRNFNDKLTTIENNL